MLLVLKKEFIEYSRLRALAQSIINAEKGPETFNEFRKIAFPWVETQQTRDREAHIKILQEEVRKGVLGIQPLWDHTKTVRSRLKTRMVQSEESRAPATPRKRSTPEARKLYAKMGSVVPT